MTLTKYQLVLPDKSILTAIQHFINEQGREIATRTLPGSPWEHTHYHNPPRSWPPAAYLHYCAARPTAEELRSIRRRRKGPARPQTGL